MVGTTKMTQQTLLQMKLHPFNDVSKFNEFIQHLDNVSDATNNINFVVAGDAVLVECEMQELGGVFYPTFADWVNNTNPVVVYPDDCICDRELSEWDKCELENKRMMKM